MAMILRPLAIALLCGVLVPACAGTGTRGSSSDRYIAHAGAEINEFRYATLYSWTRVDDDHVAVWTRPGEAYLLGLRTTCLQLGLANTIALDGFGGRVRVGMDAVIAGGVRCHIDSIRPIDLAAMRGAGVAG